MFKTGKKTAAPHTAGAFTLIELLIVIAIIAILAAILLPVLARAKQRGERAYCLNNMHQLAVAWIMYTDDNNGTLPPNGDTSDQSTNTWVDGIMQWDTVMAPHADNYNTSYLYDSLLGPYCGHAVGVYKCPGDTKQGVKGSRVRSVSMNAFMNGISGQSQVTGLMDLPNYVVYNKITSMIAPGPSDLWVFLDEQGDSINDGFFLVAMNQTTSWYDRPANYHGGTGAFSFADGHAESRKWHDGLIANEPVTGVNPTPYQPFTADPTAGDLAWMQLHSTTPAH